VTGPSVNGLVSVNLEGVTIDQALDLMLAGTGYRVSRQPDYYLVYNPDAGADFFTDLAETRLVSLDNLTPAAARGLLPQPLQRFVRVDDASGRLAVTAPQDLLERIVADLRILDQSDEQITTFIALEFIRPDNARELLPVNLQRFVRTDSSRNTIAVTAPEENRTEILTMLRRLDVPRGPASVDAPDIHRTRIVKLAHARAENTLNLLPEAVAQYVRADAESNTLAISAPRHIVDGIIADINAIDAPRRHVMLDARVVVLERADLLDFGTDFRWPQVSAGGVFADNVDFPWEVRIGYSPSREFTNALSLTLNFLSTNQQATIISSPQVLAQDGITSEIRVTTEEFFQIVANDSVLARAQLEQIETGTILSITPRVGGSGGLTLDLDLEVSDVVGRGENNLPVISRRTAQSTVRIEDGGTAAVAGLVDTRSQIGHRGMPGTRSVPLLGRLFGTDSLNHQARQVAIFVTATIVSEDGERFRTGAQPAPSIRDISDEQYRAELEAALFTLTGGN
jgi:type II secretory pathway component GspD/PulD (secretin)